VIGVTDSTGTTFYDGDLNVIAEAPDVDLDDGYLSGRFSDGMGGNACRIHRNPRICRG
jgi:hypothetical protein